MGPGPKSQATCEKVQALLYKQPWQWQVCFVKRRSRRYIFPWLSKNAPQQCALNKEINPENCVALKLHYSATSFVKPCTHNNCIKISLDYTIKWKNRHFDEITPFAFKHGNVATLTKWPIQLPATKMSPDWWHFCFCATPSLFNESLRYLSLSACPAHIYIMIQQRESRDGHQGPLLLKWINYNPNMDKSSHTR